MKADNDDKTSTKAVAYEFISADGRFGVVRRQLDQDGLTTTLVATGQSLPKKKGSKK